MSQEEVQQQQEDQFTFKLQSIDVNNFRISIPSEGHDAESISLEFGANFEIEVAKDITTCNVHFRFLHPNTKDPEKPLTIMHIDIAYTFNVIDLKNHSKEFNGKLGLESVVHLTLLSVAFSTSRGIIYERTRGYFPDRMLIPVINPKDFNLEVIGRK